MTIEQTLTDQERLADLSLDQLKELVGLVEYDASSDPFPITGWDALVWVVGNATQAAHFYQLVYGMELVAYAGPATGNRDHHSFVLESGAVPLRAQRRRSTRPARCVDRHRRARRRHQRHRAAGARRRPLHRARPRGRAPRSSRSRTTSATSTARCGCAAIAAYGDTRHTLVDRSRYAGPYLPGYVARTSDPRPSRGARAALPGRSTTSSATSSSATWTSGSSSTTGSWASPTWPSSSATTSPPSTRR